MLTVHGVKTYLAGLAACLAVMGTAACGGSNGSEEQGTETAATATSATTTQTSEAAPPPAATGPTLTIEDFKFTDLTVPPGAQVTVVNNDSAEHSVTSDTAGTFDVEVDGKKTTTFTAPTQPGTYPFHCTPHLAMGMKGTITVQ